MILKKIYYHQLQHLEHYQFETSAKPTILSILTHILLEE